MQMESSAHLLSTVQGVFGGYLTQTAWLPTAVCPSHRRAMMFDGRCATTGEKDRVVNLIAHSSIAVRLSAANCDGSSCRLCVGAATASDPIRPPTPKKRPETFVSMPPKVIKRRKKSATKPVAVIDRETLAALGSAAGLSGTKSRLQADELSRRASNFESNVAPEVAGRTLERDISEYSHTFDKHFASKECDFSSTGRMVYCKDIVDFVYLLCWLRDFSPAQLRYLKIGGDDGRGSLKLMLATLFEGDPLLEEDDVKLPSHPDGNGGVLDSGVNRVYIIAIMYGAKETFESSQMLLDSINLKALVAEFPKVKLCLCQDMKYSNAIAGVATHSSRYPLIYSYFSPFASYSEPDSERTIEQILSDNAGRKAVSGNPIDFHSVVSEPCPFIASQSLRSLRDLFPPPQLHLLLGIVSQLFKFLSILDISLADDFLELVHIRRSPRATQDFVGNDARKICSEIHRIRALKSFPSRASRSNSQKSSVRAILLVVSALEAFSTVVHDTMTLHLHAQWRASITHFRECYDEFVKAYEVIHPVQHARDPKRYTPKLACLFHEVPLWISENSCSLSRISEQSFEAVHKRFGLFIRRYKVAAHGKFVPSKLSKKEPTPSPFPASHTPSSGTRSGNTARKLKEYEQKTTTIESPKMHRVGNIQSAHIKHVRAVTAFNCKNLPFSLRMQKRQLLAKRCLHGAKACRKLREPDVCFDSEQISVIIALYSFRNLSLPVVLAQDWPATFINGGQMM